MYRTRIAWCQFLSASCRHREDALDIILTIQCHIHLTISIFVVVIRICSIEMLQSNMSSCTNFARVNPQTLLGVSNCQRVVFGLPDVTNRLLTTAYTVGTVAINSFRHLIGCFMKIRWPCDPGLCQCNSHEYITIWPNQTFIILCALIMVTIKIFYKLLMTISYFDTPCV